MKWSRRIPSFFRQVLVEPSRRISVRQTIVNMRFMICLRLKSIKPICIVVRIKHSFRISSKDILITGLIFNPKVMNLVVTLACNMNVLPFRSKTFALKSMPQNRVEMMIGRGFMSILLESGSVQSDLA
jgi:hypothetical protein